MSSVTMSPSTSMVCSSGPTAAPNGPNVRSFSTNSVRLTVAGSSVIGSLPVMTVSSV